MQRVDSFSPLLFLIVAAVFISGCSQQSTVIRSQSGVNWFRSDGSVNWEAEKQQKYIQSDTIVIHHTDLTQPTSWEDLSLIGRERLYIPRYASESQDPYVKGKTVHSGHFRKMSLNGKVEVFYAYHWLVRADGLSERLLADEEVGWHSGDWIMNMRSIAICFDGDFSQKAPTRKALRSCARLISNYKRRWSSVHLIGHVDVVSTTCPGTWFNLSGRDKLLTLSGLKIP